MNALYMYINYKTAARSQQIVLTKPLQKRIKANKHSQQQNFQLQQQPKQLVQGFLKVIYIHLHKKAGLAMTRENPCNMIG